MNKIMISMQPQDHMVVRFTWTYDTTHTHTHMQRGTGDVTLALYRLGDEGEDLKGMFFFCFFGEKTSRVFFFLYWYRLCFSFV